MTEQVTPDPNEKNQNQSDTKKETLTEQVTPDPNEKNQNQSDTKKETLTEQVTPDPNEKNQNQSDIEKETLTEQVTPDPNEKNQNQSDIEKETLEESKYPELSSTNSDDTNSDNPQLSSEQISEIYINEILKQIKTNWQLPSYLTNKNLTTQLEIKIDSQGRVVSKEILISSGYDIYDSFVLKMIEKGSPYLKPPNSVQKEIKDGIVLIIPSQ